MNDVRRARAEWRRRLRAKREALAPAIIKQTSTAIAQRLEEAVPELRSERFGFYWPLPGEPDLRVGATGWVEAGGKAALPETIRGQPLIFRPWTPQSVMRKGVWDIPIPDTTERIAPSILLIPCLGFDRDGYRLGHGGGYYDRTLAALSPRPLAIGVAYSWSELPSIEPQPHDIPMDMIITENA